MLRFYRGCQATFQHVLIYIHQQSEFQLPASSPTPGIASLVLVGTLWCLKCGCIFMTNKIEYIFILIFIDHRNILLCEELFNFFEEGLIYLLGRPIILNLFLGVFAFFFFFCCVHPDKNPLSDICNGAFKWSVHWLPVLTLWLLSPR